MKGSNLSNIMDVLSRSIRSRIYQGSSFRRILQNFSWLVGDSIIRLAAGLLVGIVVARYLGPERFGTLNYVLAFSAMFTAAAGLGLEQIVIRSLVSNGNTQDGILGTAFVLRLAGSIAAAAISVAAIFVLKTDDPTIILLCSIAASSLLFGPFDVFDMWFQAKVQSKYTVIARNIAFIICALIKFLFVIYRYSLIYFVAINVIEIAIGAIGLIILYQRSGQSLNHWRLQFPLARKLIVDAWPLALSGVMIMVYMKIDQIMVSEMAGRHELGIYAVAVRVAEIWYFIPAAIVSSIFPSLIAAREESQAKYYNRLGLLYFVMTWMGISVAIIMTFLATPVITLLYGSQYADAGSILAVSIWAGVFVAQGAARSKWMIIENLQNYALFCFASGLAMNILLNFLLIPGLKAKGAAYAALCSQFVVAIVAPAFFAKTRDSSFMLLESFYSFRHIKRIWQQG